MQLIFTGDYTAAETITIDGVTFNGREPSEVPDGSRLLRHPEFKAYHEPAKPRKRK